jgi:hypothetical protein
LVFIILVGDESLLFALVGVYPKVAIDVDVSSGEDDVIKKSTGDDAGDEGASSAKTVAPNPIRSDALGQFDPSVIDWVASTAPPVGGRKRKCPPPVPKRK